MNCPELMEDQLLKRIATGDVRAFETLYDRYVKIIYSFSMRMLDNQELAEELVQDVFLKVWKNAVHFDPIKGKTVSWLLSITHNRAVDLLREKNRHLLLYDPADQAPVNKQEQETGSLPEEQLEIKQLNEQVRFAMNQLPREQQVVLEMAYYRGYSSSEIAQALNIPPGTVKSRIRLALGKMQKFLGTEGVRH